MNRMRGTILMALLAGLGTAPGVWAQSADEVAFVQDLFRDLLPLSYAKRREHCGFIGRDATGALVMSGPVPGTLASCTSDLPQDFEAVASYHTHGAFDRGYYNELPSEADVLSDAALGVGGWIATPGGRLWYVDGTRMVVKQVCSVGCLPVAPGFTKAQAGEVAKTYTLEELRERLGL